jgi:4-phosphopantoate--beta-alanine ligase
MIPKNHPRYQSLVLRDKIVKAYKNGILADSGMIAHGRGEAFDYLIGEITSAPAKEAIRTAAAALLLAKSPVLSVNGNTAALAAEEIVELSQVLEAKIEINLFYRTEKRIENVEKVLKKAGASQIYGTDSDNLKYIEGIESPRATASAEGIFKADVVLVPLEDGDRAEILVNSGKTVITVDLNPLSRTSKKSSITIVDNIVRAIPLLKEEVLSLKEKDINSLKNILKSFNNEKNLKESLKIIEIREL